jgi:transcriptional regulator NrdR family protein
MTCPKCNSASVYVTETAQGIGNRIYRHRQCKECDTHFRTVEKVIESTDEYGNKLYLEAILNKSKLLTALYERKE